MPPPPLPGQTTTVPMHMPSSQPSQPPFKAQGSVPPQQQHVSQPPPPPPGAMQPASMPPGAMQPGSMRPPPSGAPQATSQPPHYSQPPMPQMPPISRAMEATAVVPRQSNNAGLYVALIIGIIAVLGLGAFLLSGRTGTL